MILIKKLIIYKRSPFFFSLYYIYWRQKMIYDLI